MSLSSYAAAPGAAPDPYPASLVGDVHAARWTVSATRSVRYDVHVVPDLLDPANDALEAYAFGAASTRRVLVVDAVFARHFGARLRSYLAARRLPTATLIVQVEESTKTVEQALGIARWLDAQKIDRRADPLVVFGGGVLLDVVGWVASVYRRGSPYIRIPTTLLAIVDAAVGVKTGLNHNGGKNRLGTYHPPDLALLDPRFLATLPERHISNGLAEVAKMGLMTDATAWHLLDEHAESLVETRLGTTDPRFLAIGEVLIRRAVHAMLVELHDNLWESNLERLVDFGHTFSPSFEMRALPTLLHGEAVALDMALSCAIAAGRGLLSTDDARSAVGVLRRLGLPTRHAGCTSQLAREALEDTARHRGGAQRAPLPAAIGAGTFVNDITAAELSAAFAWLEDPRHRARR